MLIALLSDIHGNREALEACLDHAARYRAERTIFLGDLVGYGADPGFVVDTVRASVERGAVALLGNHDAAASCAEGDMNAAAMAAIRWTRERLDEAQRSFLRSLPLTHTEGDRLFVHASAAEPASWPYVTGARAAEISLRCTEARVTFCGHTHVPLVFHAAHHRPPAPFAPVAGCGIPLLPQRRWVAVLGSVGQPRDGDPAACYALLHHEMSTLTYFRVPYDAETAARKILDAGLPPSLAQRLLEGR